MMGCLLICSIIFERQTLISSWLPLPAEIPVEATAEDEAPLTEWALKIKISVP